MRRWFFAGVVLGISLSAGGGWLLFRWWQSTDRIAFGVRVQGVSIGGLKATEALRVLSRSFPEPLFARITVPVTFGRRVVSRVKLKELHLEPDGRQVIKVALEIGRRGSLLSSLREFLVAWREGINLTMRWQYDESSAEEILLQLARNLNRPPRRAWIELEGGSVRIVPSRDGMEIEVDKTLEAWRERLNKGQWENLPLIARTIRPEVTTDDVAAIDGVVGKATTYFSTGEHNRAHNIRLAAARLDHVVIRPGETISFNELVGPRTPKRGFRIAKVLARGEFIQDFGGGVCQVAGTLYLASLRSGMEVVCRHRHSRPVHYLPPGLDATVNFGSLDLKLRNPFPTPLYLRTFVKGGKLTVLILGKRRPGSVYRIVRNVKRLGRMREIQVPDPSLIEGVRKVVDKGSVGYRVEVWRLLVEDGIVVKREHISTDIYPPRPRREKIGAKRIAPDTQPSESAVSVSTVNNNVSEHSQTSERVIQ